MIGKLTGRVDSTGEDWAIIDVAGVGYVTFCSGRTLGHLTMERAAVSLHIETHVREDHIHLYGFLEVAERDWFRLLCTVQGVGAKMALAILSVLGPEELAQAIAAQDKALLTRANGVGPKRAGRITAELKDKAGDIALRPMVVALNASSRPAPGEAVLANEDAVSALVNLGYGRSEAFGAVAAAGQSLGDQASVESLITASLRELAS